MPLVEELDLLISLCAMVVTAVPQSDLVSLPSLLLVVRFFSNEAANQFATNTGFGSLHNAILSLASKILGNTRWSKLITPSNETEVSESSRHGLFYSSLCDFKVCL